MNDHSLEWFFLSFKPCHLLQVTDYRILIHISDYMQLLKDPRVLTFLRAYPQAYKEIFGREICTYQTEEEYQWQIILG